MTNSRKGLLLALLACAGSAGYLTFFKLAVGDGSVADTTLVTLFAAALLNSGTTFVQEHGRPSPSFDRLSVLFSLAFAVLTLAGNECAVGAVVHLSAPITSVMQQTQVLFVAIFGLLLLDDRVSVRFWIGAGVAVSGLCVLNLAPDEAVHVDAAGSLMAVGSAACFALMAVLTRRYIHRIRPVAVNALRLWMAIALWFVVHHRLPSFRSHSGFIAFATLAGVSGPFFSRNALMYALAHISATRTTLVGLLTPVITLVPAYLLFRTVPTPREFLGAVIMISGVAIPLLERSEARAQIPAPARG